MYVQCINRRSRNDQHYALICAIPLFYILAPTYFGRSLPSSGSFLGPPELLEIQIELVVYHTIWHTGHVITYYISPIRFVFQVTQKDLRSSMMMAGYYRNI
jgi:hypothetical protein